MTLLTKRLPGAETTYICTKDGLKSKTNLVYWQSSALRKDSPLTNRLAKIFCRNAAAFMKDFQRWFISALQLQLLVFTVSIFSTWSFHWEVKGENQGKYLPRQSWAPLFLATLYRQKSGTWFSLRSLQHHFRPSLVAARADYLNIQSCIFSVLCADRKVGTEQSCNAESTMNPLSYQEMNNQMFHNTHNKHQFRKTWLLTALKWAPGFWINPVLLMHWAVSSINIALVAFMRPF